MAVIDAENPAQLENLANALEANQWEGLFDEVIPIVAHGIETNFANASGPQHRGGMVRWPKRKDSEPHPLLILSGSMLAAAAWNGVGAVREIVGAMMRWGIWLGAVPYARAQQLGHAYNVKGRRWFLPPRPFLGLDDDHCEQVTRTLTGVLVTRFKEILRR